MPPSVVTMSEKLAGFSDHWNPRIVARYGDHEVRLAKVQGDFDWHSHEGSDELFLVVSGALGIEFRDGTRRLGPGELIVVPAGVEHRPFAEEETAILLMDRAGEPNTGVNPGAMTRAVLEEI